jgi:hypothetical protein
VNPVRRISESLREMRWAQLVLELALLILGILIALAVDGWMDDRRDARLERQYLERLARDLDQNIGILREFVDFEEKQVADGVLAYRALRGVEPAEREAVSQAIDHLAPRPTSNLPDASVDRSGVFERLGVPVDETQDRLWTLPEGSPERAVLTNRILRRTRAGAVTRAQAESLERQVQEVRAAVAAALAR